MSFSLLKDLAKDGFFVTVVAAGPVVWLVLYFSPLFSAAGGDLPLERMLLLVFLLPILEELAFRGLIQGYLSEFTSIRERRAKLTGANWITSLLFTAAHALYHALPQTLLVFIPSLIFGELRDRYQSTIPSILLHCYYNLGFFLTLSIRT
jgi:membrane protease YdiL (CAAX protease family)